MIKLIASDIDGTLLQHGETQISPRFFQLAEKLMDNGIAVCAASGRQYTSLRRLFAPIADRMYFLCENGGNLFGPGQTPVLLGKTVMNRAQSLALCRDISEIPDCDAVASGVDHAYLCPTNPDLANRIRYLGNNTTVLADFAEMPENFTKISAFCRQGAAHVEPQLRPKWQDIFQVAIAGEFWLDFTLSTKGSGMAELCQAIQISPKEVMAFGDNYNDCTMLDTVGHSYLMDSAAPALRARYAHQCTRVEDILETLL